MCGVPVIRSDEYLQKLIAAGFRIAVCEQLEDPAEAKKRGAKSVVKRDVVRLVTPGTITEESLLDAAANSFLTALFKMPGDENGLSFALASLDISTGECIVGGCSAPDLPGELARLAPREVLLSDGLSGDKGLRAAIDTSGAALTPLPQIYFSAASGETALKQELKVSALDGFGGFSRAELAAFGALLKYVEITQLGQRPVLRPPRRVGRRRIPLHRRGDPRQSGIDPLAVRSEAGQPACRHRPHGDQPRKPRTGGPARQPADRSRRHQCAA